MQYKDDITVLTWNITKWLSHLYDFLVPEIVKCGLDYSDGNDDWYFSASCSLGAAQASVENATEHVKIRKQFSKPLASFQVQNTIEFFIWNLFSSLISINIYSILYCTVYLVCSDRVKEKKVLYYCTLMAWNYKNNDWRYLQV